jgi:hypothetical protein
MLLLALVALAAPRRLLIDTDAGFDVDDVGAICIANALADRQEVVLVAVAHTNAFAAGIGAVSALMTYYGRANVSLGAYKGPWARDPAAGAHPHHTADRYVSDLAAHFPAAVRSSAAVPSATAVYRRELARQPDRSVHMVSIGITTNMRDLVQSRPDEYSPLTGAELIARKVAQVVWMDGTYNFGCAQHATRNWLGPDVGCRGSAKQAVEGWPPSVHQLFTNVGGGILHGAALATCAPPSNPCRRAFADWGAARTGRMSWDPVAVLIAARGATALGLQEQTGGYNTVEVSGVERWMPDHTRPYNQSRIRVGDFAASHVRQTLAAELDRLLCMPS